MEENEKQKKKNKIIIILITVIILIFALFASIFAMGLLSDKNTDLNNKVDVTVADGETFDGNISMGESNDDFDDKSIIIHGYSQITVNKESTVDLANPVENDVYFKYTISENGVLVYETDYIRPGEKIAWNASDYITGAGEHLLQFSITTVSVDTNEPCNGAAFTVKAEVE